MHNRPVYKVPLKSGFDITSKMTKYMILSMGSGVRGSVRGPFFTRHLNLVRRFKQQSDLSLYEYKYDLSYCQWNTREPRVVPNVSFLMFSL